MIIQFKDVVTLLNPLLGFLSITWSLQGNTFWGAGAIFIAYFFDAIDGSVAKLTRTSNRFGAELDNVCDGFSFGIAPAFLVFAVFREFHPWLGYSLGFWLILCSTIRYARANLTEEECPGYFLGLNRPVSAMMIAAMVNSFAFREYHLFIPGALMTFALGLLNLSRTPYVNHRQRFSRTMKIIVYAGLALTLVPSSILGYPWEGVFTILFLYTIHPFVWLRGEEKTRLNASIFGIEKIPFAS